MASSYRAEQTGPNRRAMQMAMEKAALGAALALGRFRPLN